MGIYDGLFKSLQEPTSNANEPISNAHEPTSNAHEHVCASPLIVRYLVRPSARKIRINKPAIFTNKGPIISSNETVLITLTSYNEHQNIINDQCQG